MAAGFVLALSGIESSGKSTQRDLLIEHLRSDGAKPVHIWTRPGYSPRLKIAKRLLRRLLGRKPTRHGRVSSVSGQYPRRASTLGHPFKRWSWLTLALLDLMWVYAVQVRFFRAMRRPVICDRHLLDSLVDFRVYFPDDGVEDRWLCRLLCAVAMRPDAAFCVLIPVEESIRRTSERGRHHWETREVLAQRVRAYRALAADLHVPILDGCQPVERTASFLQDCLAQIRAASSIRVELMASRLGDSCGVPSERAQGTGRLERSP